MPNETNSDVSVQPPSIFEYYSNEALNFHITDGNSTTRTGRAAEQAQRAGEMPTSQTSNGQAISDIGTVVSGAGTALGVLGEVMSLPEQITEAAVLPIMSQLTSLQGIACLPAASHLDPVLGIDVHLVMIPPSPTPIPMPHVYVAIVMDPMDWVSCVVMSVMSMVAPTPTEVSDDASDDEAAAAAVADAAANVAFNATAMALGMMGMGATVMFGGVIPRAVSGVKNEPVRHFPMGSSFAPIPVIKNSGHVQFGSLFAVADGEPFAGLMHMNNDCWDIGIMALMRRKYPSEPMHLYMPTGFIMAIPSSGVLVNPVPTPINPQQILRRLFRAAFARFRQARRRRQEAEEVPPNRCTRVGHPVDVATGKLFTSETDFSLPGPLPLSWERIWYSTSDYNGPLGYGWHHSYDMALFVDHMTNEAIFRTKDGRKIRFSLPLIGEYSYKRTEKLRLYHHEEGYYYIVDADELIFRFNNTDNSLNKNKNWQLIRSISNRNGFAIKFIYNSKRYLEKIIDSVGRTLNILNDSSGRIVYIKTQHPSDPQKTLTIACYDYNDNGNMICQTDALNQKMYFEYQDNLMVKETWRNGCNWYFIYDGRGKKSRCIRTWGDGGILDYKITYHNGYTIAENSLGFETTYFHKEGLVYRMTDPLGAEWLYRFNNFNELEWETDPLGNQRNYSHDEWGNIIAATDPCGGFTSTEYYNARFPFLPIETVDAGGGKWKWEYDEQSNVTAQTNPFGSKTNYYYLDGQLTKIVNSAGAITQLQYDNDQNLCSIQTDDGAITEYSYDALGNCTVATNPNGLKQRRYFDEKGRIEKVNDFDGNIIYLYYDGIDNVTRYTDKQKEVDFTYCGLGKLTSRTEAGASILFKYDTEEQLLKITNEHNLPYRFELDAAGNVVQDIGFDGITRRYERNAAGWVTHVHGPTGKCTRYSYDDCGRVTEVFYSDGKKEGYAYHPDGELIQAVNESATVTFERDVAGNIIKETVNGEWITSEYDVFGNRTSITSSLGANIQHQYSKMGDLLQMKASGWEARFEHDLLGLEINRWLPGGISSQWQRDGIGRPVMQTVGHTAKNNITTRQQKQYTWDVNDRLKQIRNEKGVTKFEHDGWSNLAKTIFPNGEVQWRNPDASGNLFQTADRKDRVYAKGGQLRKAGGWEYSYDAEGNLVKKLHVGGEEWTYEWNDVGMLTKVTRPDKAVVTFAYDALGRRLWKRYKNTTTKFVWDGNVPLHEWKEHALTGEKLSDIQVGENGITTWLFDTDSFAPCGKIKGERTYSIVTDHLGTPAQIFKEDGSLFWEGDLDTYGKVRMEKGEAGSCPFRYQGQYEDIEIGLFYNRFRYYSIDGSFISKDPIGLAGGILLYGYVHDPNFCIDVLGLTSSCSENAKILRENMAREGRIVGPNQAAGHIVASTGSKGHWAPAAKSRALLAKYRIGVNDAANGIPVNHPNPHGRMHSADYHKKVYERLSAVESRMQNQGYGAKATRSALRRELRTIGKEPL